MKMMVILALISAPLLKEQTYAVRVTSCSGDILHVETQNSAYTISLFNVDIKTEEGKEYSCKRIAEAKKIEIMIDRYANSVDRISAWVYVDDNILQKELVERSYAQIRIKNPEYHHYEQMMDASIVANASAEEQVLSKRSFDRTRANRFITYNIFGLSSLCVFSLILRLAKKRRNL